MSTETIDVIQTSEVSGALEVHPGRRAVLRASHRLVEEVRHPARDDHEDAHREDPHQELHLHGRLLHREQDERDERHAR